MSQQYINFLHLCDAATIDGSGKLNIIGIFNKIYLKEIPSKILKFAAVIAIVLFYPGIYLVSSKVSSIIPGVSLISYFLSNIFQFSSLLLFAGAFLGIFSSLVAIRRFLRI